MFSLNWSLWQYDFIKDFQQIWKRLNLSKIVVSFSPFNLPTSLISQTDGHLTSNSVNNCRGV